MVFAKNSTINSCTLETDISLRDHMHIAVESCFTGIGLRAKNYIQVLPGGFTRTHIFALIVSKSLKSSCRLILIARRSNKKIIKQPENT